MKRLITKAATASATIAAVALFAAQTVSASGYYTYSTTASDAAAATFFSAAMLIPCCIIVVMYIFFILGAVWVYKDAQKYKIENAILWAVISFLFPIVGELIYILAIKPEAVKKQGGTPTAK